MRRAEYLTSVFRQLRRPDGRAPALRIPHDFVGLGALLDSFGDHFVYQRADLRHEKVEWNPFNQRLLVLSESTPLETLEESFAAIEKAVLEFIFASHEAVHVLSWEPFFVGKHRPRDEAAFLEQSFAYEALAFWYSDLVVTPRIRAASPDGELVHSRSVVSSNFHPYRALKAAGVGAGAALDVYLQAFAARDSALLHGGDIYTRNLAKRIYAFYQRHLKPAQGMYRALTRIGVFDELYGRFCAIEGLPTLFPAALLAHDPNRDADAYCRAIARRAMRSLDALPRSRVAAVRLRRAAQTRAYFALVLRDVLARGQVGLENGRSLPARRRAAAVDGIETYLAGIERALVRLAAGEGAAAKTALAKADEAHRAVARALAGTWLTERDYLLPGIPGIGERTIAVPSATCLRTPREVEQLFRHVYARVSHDGGGAALRASLDRRVAALFAALARRDARPGRVGWRALTAALDDFLWHPLVRPRWTVPAAQPSAHSHFRELSMVFE